jgi:hypothetical protein
MWISKALVSLTFWSNWKLEGRIYMCEIYGLGIMTVIYTTVRVVCRDLIIIYLPFNRRSNLHHNHFRENWFGSRMRNCELFSFIGWSPLDSPYTSIFFIASLDWQLTCDFDKIYTFLLITVLLLFFQLNPNLSVHLLWIIKCRNYIKNH